MARPACPRHPNSKVWLDGSYGPPGRRRQRFHCVDGGHVFTETLPRLWTASAECLDCERPLARYEGQPVPRRLQFTTREIASALVRLGQGMSYRAAGRHVRRRAGRAEGRDGSVVEDWVEIFAPVVYEPHAPDAWPDVLVLDELVFAPRARPDALPFRVLAAMGGDGKLYRLEGFAAGRRAPWEHFLTALPGQPTRIVCADGNGMLSGIRRVWPGGADRDPPIVFLGDRHVRSAVGELLRDSGRAAAVPLEQALEDALGGRREWRELDSLARAARCRALVRWLDRPDPTWWAGATTRSGRIAWQLENRAADPITTGLLEARLLMVERALGTRVFSLRNRERTNRLLMLMTLHANGVASESAFARLIRAYLVANGGHSAARKRITDRKGFSSLRR